jgi:hypothetical protein
VAEHTVFGASAPPWGEPSANSDGSPSIVTGTAFYSTATAWFVVGGRLRIPAGATLPGTVTLALRVYPYETAPDYADAPVRTAVATVAEGWIEARWDSYALTVGQVAWITAEDFGVNYLFAVPPSTDPVQASDASDLYMAEAGDQWRSAFRIGTGGTSVSSGWYGADLIVSDDVGVSVTPDGIPATSAVGTPVVTTQTTPAPSGIASPAEVGTPVLATSVTVSPSGIARTTALGSPTTNGPGFNLPIKGTLVPLTPARAMVPLTPRRGLDIA